jgi:cytoskeletal protein CcmA (bactofilin family)
MSARNFATPPMPDTLPVTRASSTIDPNTVVDGSLTTSQDLRVEGRVSGTVRCDGVLTVAAGAEVDASVDASDIVVAGALSGTVQCHGRLVIQASGVVRARIETVRLVIEEGAVYEGQLRMIAPPEPEPAAAQDVVPDAEPPAVSTAPAYPFLRNFPVSSPQPQPAERDLDLPGSTGDEEPS